MEKKGSTSWGGIKGGDPFCANILVTGAGRCFLSLQVLGFCAAGNHFAVHQGLGDSHHFGLHRSGDLFVESILEPERMEVRSVAVRNAFFSIYLK